MYRNRFCSSVKSMKKKNKKNDGIFLVVISKIEIRSKQAIFNIKPKLAILNLIYHVYERPSCLQFCANFL